MTLVHIIFLSTEEHYWINFNAIETDIYLDLNPFENNILNTANITYIELLHGNCSELISDTILIFDFDSTFHFSDLMLGETYYIKITRALDIICPPCNENKGFDLCLRMAGENCLYHNVIYFPSGVQNPQLCSGAVGSICHIDVKPCDVLCFAAWCFVDDPNTPGYGYPGGIITYSITPPTSSYSSWTATTDEITPFCIDPGLLAQGATYQIDYFINEPGGTITNFNEVFTFTITQLQSANDAISSNTFCTSTDLMNAILQQTQTSSFLIDGIQIEYTDPIFMSNFFTSLSYGTHTICHEVVNDCYQESLFCEDFEIISCEPIINININCSTVLIQNLTPNQFSYISWNWNFGDGTTFNGPNPVSHTYNSPGIYTITLTAIDNSGVIHTFTQNITPVFGMPMDLVLPPNSCCTSAEISVNENYYNYQWTITPTVLFAPNDNIINAVFDPSQTYDICVTAFDDISGCPVTACGTIEPCCKYDQTLVTTSPNSPDNHNFSLSTFFTQVCEYEKVSNLISNYSWNTIMVGKEIILRNDLEIDQNLTLRNCKVRVGEDFKIIVKPGVTFRIESTDITNACDFMWAGILLENTSSVFESIGTSLVTQAEQAITSENGGKFDIIGLKLKNNYRSIVINPYSNSHPGTITQSTIEGTNFGMIAPHTTDAFPFSGIEIKDVKEITIGSGANTIDQNLFKKLKYGIISNNANLNIYNNKFDKIQAVNAPYANLINNNSTMAIWVQNGYSGAPTQFVNIGNVGTAKNIFTDSKKGIQIHGRISSNIIGNEFDNITSVNIYCLKTDGKAINILNNSITGKFGIGVLCVDFLKSIVQVKNNSIYEDVSYNHAPSYLNTGIGLANVVANASIYNIENNIIYRCENGIIADGVPTVLIKNNNVVYSRSNTQIINLAEMHHGIWVKNSKDCEVTLNTISRSNPNPANNGTPALTSYLRGITVELSPESFVHDNTMKQMGYGMHWIGSSMNSTITCNIMEKCYNGVFFDNAEIGHQGNATNPSGNYWVNNQSVTEKMSGNLVTLPITNWYAVLTGLTNPNPHGVDPNELNVNPASGNANCQIAPGGGFPGPMNPQKREAMFGSIVRDEIQFLNYSNENRMNNRKYLYNVLKNDPSIITLGGTDDTDYQTYFNTVLTENEGKIEDINLLIADTNYAAAANINASIQVSIVAEENQKTLNEIYLSTWAIGNEIDTNQFLILEAIACQSPLEGGSSVYGARIMIGLDYECVNGANRNQEIEAETTNELENNFIIFPNPSDGLFKIQNNYGELLNGRIQIIDITGKIIEEFTLNSTDETFINIFSLTEGIYYYLIYSDNEIIYGDKLIILK